MLSSTQSDVSATRVMTPRHGRFQSVPMAPKDTMFGLKAAYLSDTSPNKVDLGPGAYRDDDAMPWVLPVVKRAKERLYRDTTLDHEYLPIAGLAEYLQASQRLVLGNDCSAIKEGRVASVQTLSGTGALCLAARFLSTFYPDSKAKRVYVSSPPYANHIPILHDASLQTGMYPYYAADSRKLDFGRMIDTLYSIPNNSIVLLHACAHNPTGVDPTQEQWHEIASVMKKKNHLPFFDSAYQGFASGDLDKDVWSIRHFVQEGFDTILIAQSYAKNFGLYGERVGCLHVVTPDADLATRLQSQLVRQHRVINSTPPAYGARIAATILNDRQLLDQWKDDLVTMSGRIFKMRKALRTMLEGPSQVGNWRHLTDQIGMFCFTGLSLKQVNVLRERYHIYMTNDGRISVSGLNSGNVEYVAQAINSVLKGSKL